MRTSTFVEAANEHVDVALPLLTGLLVDRLQLSREFNVTPDDFNL